MPLEDDEHDDDVLVDLVSDSEEDSEPLKREDLVLQVKDIMNQLHSFLDLLGSVYLHCQCPWISSKKYPVAHLCQSGLTPWRSPASSSVILRKPPLAKAPWNG